MRLHHSGRRFWLHVGEHVFSLEVGRVRRSSWAEFKLGAGGYTEGLCLTAGLSWGAWLHWRPPFRWLRFFPSGERVIGFQSYVSTAHVSLWHDEWRDATQGRRPGRFKVWDNEWIVGRDRYAKRELMTTSGIVNCGEWDGDSYPVSVTATLFTWRNRFRTLRRFSYEMEVPKGGKAPPFPGKGENSWDMDEDGIYAMGSSDGCESVEAACAEYAAEVIRNRRRYGGAHWLPAALAAK